MTGTDNPWLRRLPILVASHVVGTANIVSVLAMAPVISKELDLSATQFGLFVTAYYGAQALGSLPAGGLTDRFGIGRTLIGAHLLMAIAALTLGLADGYYQSLLALFLMGLGYSMTNPSTARGVLDWFPAARRGMAMGIKQVGVPIGGVIAAANGALASWIDWHLIMLGVAVVVVVNGVLCFYLVQYDQPLPPGQRKTPMANIREVVRDSNVNVYTALCGMLNAGQASFFGFLTLCLTVVAGASQPLAGLAVGIAQTASFFARLVWGVASDRFVGRRKVLKAYVCGAGVVFLALMATIGPGWGLYYALALALLLGATVASFAPVSQAIAVEMVEPRLAGSVIGYNMVGVHIGGMIGPLIFGWLVDNGGGYDVAWLVIAAIFGLGVALLVFKFREGDAR